MAGTAVAVGSDVLTNIGLYMMGHYIQLSMREWTDKDTGERKQKYYLMMAIGATGAVNVGITVEEYAAVAQKGLSVGTLLLVPVEAFGYRDRAYFRATGPVSPVSEVGA